MKPVLLFADRDTELCDLYAMFFAERGYEVETAFDGLDCLNKLCRLGAAVLLLDRKLHWGGADGVLACLRAQTPKPGVSVVLTAGPDDPPDVASDTEPPVIACLTKPFTPELLLETVRTAIPDRRQEEPFVPIQVVTSEASAIE
jgi:DNA-binding NtrC family response regulator